MVRAFVAGALVMLMATWASPQSFARADAPARTCRCPINARGPCAWRLVYAGGHVGYVCGPVKRVA